MGAAICHIMLGEADTSHYLVGDNHKTQNFYWDLKVWLEILVELVICLILISANIEGGDMEIFNLSPSIGLLLALEPYLIDGFNCLLNHLTFEFFL